MHHRKHFGNVNFFGGPNIAQDRVRHNCSCHPRMMTHQDALFELECSDDNAAIIVLSDVWLDRPQASRLHRCIS